MKNFLKKFCVVLAALVLTAGFTACGGPSKTTLYVLSFKPEYSEIFEEVNRIFLEENPEIKKVDYKAVDTNDYNTVFSSRIQSGYLDVFTSEVTYMMQGTNNYMLPLTRQAYMDEISQEYLTEGSFYDPSSGKEAELLTLPLERVAYVVYYNKDIFEEYHLEEPATWSEFLNILEVFADAAEHPVVENGQPLTKIESALIFGGKSEWPTMNILNSVVADVIGVNQPDFFDEIVNYDTNTAIRFNNENWIDTFTKMQTIGSKVDSSIYGLDYSFATNYFSVGNPNTKKMYPMMIDGTWAYSQIRADFEVGAFALPAVENPIGQDGKKNLAVKTGTTLSVFNRSNKTEYAEKYLEIFFRDEIYQKFINYTKTPSVKSTVSQSDALVNSIFDAEKYNFVAAYDSRMPRYFPIVSASEVTALMKGSVTPESVANSLQQQVELNKEDWQKYTMLSHGA